MEEGILVGSSQKNKSVGGASKGPRSELSTLDFGSAGGDVARALAECAGKIEVQEGGDAFAGVAEDAAVLYANGQNDLAAQVLSEFVTGLTPGQGEPLWLMLIDLYKLTGKRAEFDERVIAYARSFEKSPPPWDGADTPVAAGKTAAPAVALGTALTDQVAKQFERVRESAKKNGAVRIDLSRLRSAARLAFRSGRSVGQYPSVGGEHCRQHVAWASTGGAARESADVVVVARHAAADRRHRYV
jgi:hypothetical protein